MFNEIFKSEMKSRSGNEDPAHDFLHLERVLTNAWQICEAEKGRWEIVEPAAWFHDFVVIRKDDPRRSQASQISAQAAIEYLKSIQYPSQYLEEIAHAIEAHSFSANIKPKTLEAKIVQDADRLDGLGAIGIARCFASAGLLKRAFYSAEDAFCEAREPNDRLFTVDHFYQKLFRTVETLQTESARKEGLKRAQRMKIFLEGLKAEMGKAAFA